MSEIKLKIDIKGGTVEIESDKDSFGAVVQHAEGILDKFTAMDFSSVAQINTPLESDVQTNKRANDQNGDEDKSSRRRKRPSGSGKTANWKMIDDLLDEGQRSSLKEFYAEKRPPNQNEQVAVLTFKLKELTGRDGFDGDEIHTAFQVVDKKTPGNLNAVFGNMAKLGLGKQVDKKFISNFKADDLVKHDLPLQAKEK